MRYAYLIILTMPVLVNAQDGAALYKERCASCHDSPTGRIPSMDAIKKMTDRAVYAALTTGVMKPQTSGLSTQQIFSLLVYIGPVSSANTKPAFQKSCVGNTRLNTGPSAWTGWSPS